MRYRPTYRLRGLGDNPLTQFTADQIRSAYTWLKDFADETDADRVAKTQWIHANAQTLSDAGKQAYLAGLQLETAAVNELFDAVSKFQAVLHAIGMDTGLSGYYQRRRSLGSLGVAPLVIGGIIAAVLIAAGIGIYAIYSHVQTAKAQMAQAQNMRIIADATADCIRAGTCTPQQAAAILNAGAAATQPPKDSFPWNTLFITAGVAGVAYAIFG